jgi:hypothetical protein
MAENLDVPSSVPPKVPARKKKRKTKSARGAARRSAKSTTDNIHDIDHAENICLYLPSDIPADRRLSVCGQELIDYEQRFRMAEAEDALVAVRKHLRMYGLLRSQYKGELGATGNANTTKARGLIQSFWRKIKRGQSDYTVARNMLLALQPEGSWTERFHPLLGEDLRGPYAGDDNTDLPAVEGERYREHGATRKPSSWIWNARARSSIAGGEEPVEQVRVQWSKLMAYAERWEEERTLTTEEMRRTLAYLEWRSTWWLDQV